MGGAKITRHSAIARDAYIPVYRLMYSYIYMQNIGVVVMDSLGENSRWPFLRPKSVKNG